MSVSLSPKISDYWLLATDYLPTILTGATIR
jgi:hypothetical protein